MSLSWSRKILILSLIACGVVVLVLRHQGSASLARPVGLYEEALQFGGRPRAQEASSVAQGTAADSASSRPDLSCADFNNQVETLPLSSLLSDLKDQKLKIPAQCELDSKTAALFASMREACLTEPSSEDSGCEARLFQYRARRIELWAQGQDIKSLSTEVLVQKFFGLLSSGGAMEAGGPKEIRALADELKLRLPNSSGPARVKLASFLLESETLTPEQLEDYEDTLAEARRLAPDDWQLYEIELLKTSHDDPAGYAEKIQTILRDNPNSSVGLYHAGCIAFRNGNRSQALAYFERAAENDPEDPRIPETLSQAEAAEFSASICTTSMSFAPESF